MSENIGAVPECAGSCEGCCFHKNIHPHLCVQRTQNINGTKYWCGDGYIYKKLNIKVSAEMDEEDDDDEAIEITPLLVHFLYYVKEQQGEEYAEMTAGKFDNEEINDLWDAFQAGFKINKDMA